MESAPMLSKDNSIKAKKVYLYWPTVKNSSMHIVFTSITLIT